MVVGDYDHMMLHNLSSSADDGMVLAGEEFETLMSSSSAMNSFSSAFYGTCTCRFWVILNS